MYSYLPKLGSETTRSPNGSWFHLSFEHFMTSFLWLIRVHTIEKGGNLFFTITKTIEGDLGIFFENHCESHRSARGWRNTCYAISIECTLIYHISQSARGILHSYCIKLTGCPPIHDA